MELNLKKGDLVFIDSAPLIYFWEENEKYFTKISSLFDKIYNADVQMVTSLITYIEVITYPIKAGNIKLAAKYRDYFTNSANFTLYPLNLLVAEKTASYRAEYNLKTPDAIQLATAEICGADYVITNDEKWKKVIELNVISVDEL